MLNLTAMSLEQKSRPPQKEWTRIIYVDFSQFKFRIPLGSTVPGTFQIPPCKSTGLLSIEWNQVLMSSLRAGQYLTLLKAIMLAQHIIVSGKRSP